MINLLKFISEDEILEKLSQYMLNDFNSSICTYKEQPFLLLSGWDEKDQIELFLGAYCDDIQRQWDIDVLFQYSYGFDDEYTQCSNCCQIIRTSPDSYSWQPDYLQTECEILCQDCYTIEDVIQININNPNTAINSTDFDSSELINAGFELINKDSYQNGLHEGMNDNPKEIYNQLQNQYNDIIFVISEQSQFYIEFDVYGRDKK